MAFNYTKSKAALDTIAQRTDRYRKQIVAMQTQIQDMGNGLNGMPTEYSGLVGEIDAEATASPTDEALQMLKLEKDKLVADFQALLSVVQAIQTDLNAYDVS